MRNGTTTTPFSDGNLKVLFQRRQTRLFLVLIAALLFPIGGARAELVAMPRRLNELFAQSTAIVVAKVLVAPSEATEGFSVEAGLRKMTSSTGLLQFAYDVPFAPPPPTGVRGHVISCLKGNLTGKFSATVQRPQQRFYNYYGAQPVKAGDTALFFLRREGSTWKVVDGKLPGLRLTTNATKLSEALIQAQAAPQSVARLVPLLIASLDDAEMRPTFLSQLSHVEDVRVKEALLPYIDDHDENTRDSALTGLAINQYVEVIPHIVSFAREKWRRDRTGPLWCIEAIGKIRSPKAVAALNRLLFDESEFTRLNAIMALRPIADETSIPFLMVALRDPEPQRMVCYDAYATLCRLERLPLQTMDYFAAHRDELTKPLYNRYADRLEAEKNSKMPLD